MIARAERDMVRGRRAADAVKAKGGDAMTAALAQIEATFSIAAVHNGLKVAVDGALRRPVEHPANVARYGARAVRLQNLTIDAALGRVEAWHAEEERAFAIASAFGRGSRVPLEVVAELRLMLRLARRRITDRQFQHVVLCLALRASLWQVR